MNLTKFALKRPVSMLLLVLAVVVFGALAISNTSMELIPDIDMPMQVVITTYAGADPESVEELLTKPIEDAGASLSGVDSISSSSYANYSMVMFTYDYDVDINEAYIDLRAALDIISSTLPEDASDPTIMQISVNELPTVVVAAINQGDTDLLNYVEDTVVPELESITDVAKVDVSGGDETYIQVTLDEEALQQYGLTMSSVANYITAMDFQIPAGSVNAGSQELSVSSSGAISSLSEIQSIPLITATGATITLSDVAEVNWGTRDAASISRYDGQDCVLLSVTKRQAASTVGAAKEIIATLDRLGQQNDAVSLLVSYDGSDIIKAALKSIAQSLALGVLFAMLVLFLFFGDFKASLIVGSSMPLSVLASLAMMNLLNFSLNVITAMAMIICIGMIVDCSIVVLESCFRQKEEQDHTALGYEALPGGDLYDPNSLLAYAQAAQVGADSVMTSITASTITTVVVYLPILFLSDMAAEMYGEFSWVVVITMFASLLASLTVVPLCFTRLQPKAKKHIPVNRFVIWLTVKYDRFMHRHIQQKFRIVAITVGLLILSIALLFTMNLELIPSTDEGHMTITAKFRAGTSLATIDEEVGFIEEMIAQDETFSDYDLTISDNSASFTCYRADGNKRSSDESVAIYQEALANVSGIDLDIQAYSSYSMFTGMMSQTTVTLESTDIDALREGGLMVEDALASIPGVTRVSSEASASATTIDIHIDPLLAMSNGLTAAQVAMDLYYTLSGLTAATITNSGEEYDIVLEYPEGIYTDIWALMDKTIPTNYGTYVPLRDIATVEYGEAMQMRNRTDGVYQLTITANSSLDDQVQVAQQAALLMQDLSLPEGVQQTTSMMDDMMNEELAQMGKSIFVALFLVFLVMAMQFESVRFSLMVMMSIPFSLIGSFLLLRLTGDALSLISLMGFMMMVGIVVNNGILLVDYANVLRSKGMAREEALINSGKRRLRPILMTSLTTILGMIPMVFATGTAAMLRGMAIVIIGGLTASTLLVLLMMPSFYLVFDKNPDKQKKKRKYKGWPWGKKKKAEEISLVLSEDTLSPLQKVDPLEP